MAGRPVGIVAIVVLLFLAAVVVGRLVLAVGPVVLLVAAPVVYVLLSVRGGWVRSLVPVGLFVLGGLLVALAGRNPTYAIAALMLSLLAGSGVAVGWKVLKPRRPDPDEGTGP